MKLIAQMAGDSKEIPEKILKKILDSPALKLSIGKFLKKLPSNLHAPFEQLQNIDLEASFDDMVAELDDALQCFKAPEFDLPGLKFPDGVCACECVRRKVTAYMCVYACS